VSLNLVYKDINITFHFGLQKIAALIVHNNCNYVMFVTSKNHV